MSSQATVLVVEDEEVVRRILVTVLQDAGHRVLEARDGEEAIEILDGNHVDLVISDKNLPGINGLEVLRAARFKQPHTELMMVTGYASYESVLEALRLGACEYMEKPFLDLASITQRVDDAIQRGLQRRRAEAPAEIARKLVEALRRDPAPESEKALPLAEQLLQTLHP